MFARARTTNAAMSRITPRGKAIKPARKGTNWNRIPRTNRITAIKKARLVGALSFIFLLMKKWLFFKAYL